MFDTLAKSLTGFFIGYVFAKLKIGNLVSLFAAKSFFFGIELKSIRLTTLLLNYCLLLALKSTSSSGIT